MNRKTIFSEDRRYRYTLWREWQPLFTRHQKEFVVFIGLNPSTADETKDDPTIRRCVGFAKKWSFDAFCMMNLFAYRARYPLVMKAQEDPVGIENDKYLLQICSGASLVIAAWGADGNFKNRDEEVIKSIQNMKCPGKTKDNFPRHPLFVRKDAKLYDLNEKPETINRGA